MFCILTDCLIKCHAHSLVTHNKWLVQMTIPFLQWKRPEYAAVIQSNVEYQNHTFTTEHNSSDSFGEGNGTIQLDDVDCYSTSYLHLLSCRYSTVISRFCRHSDDVAVYCSK